MKALHFRVIGISENIRCFRTKKYIQLWHLKIKKILAKKILAMSCQTNSTLHTLKSKSYM